MGYRPQVKSSRSGRGHQKTRREKTKGRKQKHPWSARDPKEENSVLEEEIVEKTLKSLSGLGNQKFGLSPFSQYFDDWLINLRKILSVFESNSLTSVDEKFTEERSSILVYIEGELAQKRCEETALEEERKALSEKNHLLAEIDAEYAAETRKIAQKRNIEIENLTRTVRNLEDQLDEIGKVKASFFGPFSRKAKAQKEAKTADNLNSAKKELEMTIQRFAIEQEKLHDEYEKRKQTTIEQVRALEKESEEQEIDTSLERRHEACEALIEAIKTLLERKTHLI